jgi:hypothetical protein
VRVVPAPSWDSQHKVGGESSLTAGITERGFRIFEVWETREQYERFINERLMPIVREIAPSDTREPDLTVYELHGFAVSPHAAGVRPF